MGMSLLLSLVAVAALLAGLWIAFQAVKHKRKMPRNGIAAIGAGIASLLLAQALEPAGVKTQGCEAASPELAAAILEGAPGATLKDVWVARTDDRPNWYFVAGQFTNPRVFGDEPNPAVWATNSLTVGEGRIYAVNAFAVEGSQWGNGPRTDLAFSVGEEGARRALVCSNSVAH